jgi:hypothetical protein
MENGQDTALGHGAVDDWGNLRDLGSRIKDTMEGIRKPDTQALVNGAIKVCR